MKKPEPKLWYWTEAVDLIRHWQPPHGCKAVFTVDADTSDMHVAVVARCGSSVSRDFKPTKPLAVLATRLEIMGLYMATQHQCCYYPPKFRRTLDRITPTLFDDRRT